MRKSLRRAFERPSRHLTIELLEPRTYLAADIINAFDGSVVQETTVAELSLTASAVDGSPISELHVGDDFVVHVWAQDIRKDPHGVFGAYLNLNWDGLLSSETGTPGHGDYYGNGKADGNASPGAINVIGGFGGPAETKSGRYEVFSVPMHAMAAGELSISTNPVDEGPAYRIWEYGIDTPLNTWAIQFGKLSLHIADGDAGQPAKDKIDVPPVQEPTTSPIIETPAVDLSLSATTVGGLPINELHVGDDFVLHVWAQDTRTNALGVFAAYLNLNWDSSLVSLMGDPGHGERFSNGKKDGNAAPGSLSHVGGFGDASQTKASRNEVFNVPMRATAAGELSIATSSADDGTPQYWVLEYGVDTEIPLNAVQFGTLSIQIVAVSPGQAAPGTADAPTLDTTTIAENETLALPQVAMPTIVITPPPDSMASSITVDIRALLSPELKAAIASRAPRSPVVITDDASDELAGIAKLELSIL